MRVQSASTLSRAARRRYGAASLKLRSSIVIAIELLAQIHPQEGPKEFYTALALRSGRRPRPAASFALVGHGESMGLITHALQEE